ncbi:hypothetical protein PsYK624_149210 [Phanerochaete sordida]|uniref:Uncharacterized protein n=1 Tax=Phanerochaete sordida TaxID=48140 RepID=A0A9P3GPV7_9APHY|nr:hypothetical protein PsYK624_149210 [Phanerochaete sordida]
MSVISLELTPTVEKVATYENGQTCVPQKGDIVTVYHPHSHLPTTVHSQANYEARAEYDGLLLDDVSTLAGDDSDDHARPWHPFTERLDFEFAEAALDARLNQAQIDKFLAIIKSVARPDAAFTLKSSSDLDKAWSRASVLQTPFEQHEVQVAYKKQDYKFEVWNRSLWDWVLDQLHDPRLAPFLHWDARRLYRFDGHNWVGFVNEPFTASRAWNVQVQYPYAYSQVLS